jgi:MFS family permease
VAWAAIASGAFVTAALFLALLALGAGVGLSSLSPWSNSGASPSAVGIGALLWLTAVELLSCAIGGYVAGRLRTKWVDVHSDEVYFRDTAHGFLVWAVAFVATAAFLASASTAWVGGENRNASASRSETAVVDANRYFIDSLFRSAQPPSTADEALRSEVGLIFAHSLRQRELSESDRGYVADTVAARTGIPRPEAEQRVTDTFTRAQQATDTARKAVAHSLYWLFVALLLGAFAASLAATFGGKQRDHAHLGGV